tara:strand:- start:860 stop:2164 length:1305 start_codon:yes stop_codon:yes gene_type:complete
MSRRLIFTGGVPADVDNRFTPGSGVGGRSRAVRRALVRRAANSTCCQPGGGASGGHGAPGGGVQPVILKDVDVGFWIESSGKPLDKIQAIFGALNGNDGTYPGPNIKILVLRMNSYSRPATPPNATAVATLLRQNNDTFYDDINASGSFANWANANSGLLSGVEEIWVVPYQDIDSGFDKQTITLDPTVIGGYTNMPQQYMNDLWVAANFINNTWKPSLPSEIANKVKGVVFELENTSLEKYHTAVHEDATLNFNLYSILNVAMFGAASLKAGSMPPSAQNIYLTGSRTWSGAGITPNNRAAITGGPATGNPLASDEYSAAAATWKTEVYYWRGYSKYFPQIYNVGNLIVPGNQDMTNVKFWKIAREGWQKDSSYSRMFSLEAPNTKEDKWGKGAFLSNPSLAGVIQYIRQQGGLGTSVLFMPADFDYSAPLIG